MKINYTTKKRYDAKLGETVLYKDEPCIVVMKKSKYGVPDSYSIENNKGIKYQGVSAYEIEPIFNKE